MTRDCGSRAGGAGTARSGYGTVARLWEWLLLAWIAVLPVMHPFNLRFAHRYTLPLADLVFGAAFVAFLAATILRAHKLRPCSWYWPLLAYACALTASTLASDNVRRSAPKLAGDLYLIAAAVLVVNYATSPTALRRAVMAWLTGAAVTILATAAGVFLFFFGATSPAQNTLLYHFGSLPPGHYPRIRALFLNANMMCSYMVAATMMVVAARQRTGRDARRQRNLQQQSEPRGAASSCAVSGEAGWISRGVFRVMLAGAVATAAFSISPGLGGLFLLWGLWKARSQPTRPKARLAAAAGLMAALAFFISATISPTPMARKSLIEGILHPEPSVRVQTWAGAWHTFVAHPWLGRGLETNAAGVRYLNASGNLTTLTNAHNTWLSIMAQQGFAGVCAFAWVVIHLARRFRLFAGPRDGTAALRASLELAMLGGFLYSTLTGSYENTRHVWALMGLVAAVQELPD